MSLRRLVVLGHSVLLENKDDETVAQLEALVTGGLDELVAKQNEDKRKALLEAGGEIIR